MKILDTAVPLVVAALVSGSTIKLQPSVWGTFPTSGSPLLSIVTSVYPQFLTGSNSRARIADVENKLYLPLPAPVNFTLSEFANADSVTILGTTFAMVASGASGQQFNNGGTDALSAANLVTAINTFFASTFPRIGLWFQTQGSIGPSFQVSGQTTAGSGASQIIIEGSNDGIVPWATPIVSAITLTLGIATTANGQTNLAQYAYVRAKINSMSGTGASVQTHLNV